MSQDNNSYYFDSEDEIIEDLELGIKLYRLYKKYKTYKKKKNMRRFWVHKIYRARNQTGFFVTTYPKIKEDPEKFFKYTRMNLVMFNMLLGFFDSILEKFSIRTPLSSEFRLVLTLMYLAHGGSRLIYCSKFLIGETTLRRVIYETCTAIWDVLKNMYIAFPNTHELETISHLYYERSKMPNCVGAIDGKHINIVCPKKSGSQYYNYKGRFSIVLLAACDANCSFTMVDIKAYGSQSNGGIFRNSAFGKLILTHKLPLPQDKELPDTNEKFPYYFVADAAFPLKKNLLRPFPGKNLSPDKQYFNEKLSSARITIENAFGIMACRWRILLNTIHASPHHVDVIVKAITILHNYLILNNVNYTPSEWRNEIQEPLQSIPMESSNRSSNKAFTLREKLCSYLLMKKNEIINN